MTPPSIRPKATWTYALTLFLLTLLLHEVHELVHVTSGRIACGAYGERGFNMWSLVDGCEAVWPTLIGPAFTFAVTWLGAAMLYSDSVRRRHLGFALLFASMPFARILTAAMESGDEVSALYRLGLEDLAFPLGLGIVLALAVPPLAAGYTALDRSPRWAWFLGFLLLPVLLDIVFVLIGMDALLQAGVLDGPGLLGSPVLINVYTAVLIASLVVLGPRLLPDARRPVQT